MPSQPAVIRRDPSGENCTQLTSLPCGINVCKGLPVLTSQVRIALAGCVELAATIFPSGEHATWETFEVCPLNERTSLGFSPRTSYMATCVPPPLVKTNSPSGEKQAAKPSSVNRALPSRMDCTKVFGFAPSIAP